MTSVDAPLAPRFMFLQVLYLRLQFNYPTENVLAFRKELKMSFLGTYADAIQYETLRNKCFQDRFLPVMLNLMVTEAVYLFVFWWGSVIIDRTCQTKYSDGVFDPTEQLKEELNRVETMMIDVS